MFFKGSRYEKMASYTITTLDGRQVTATRLPLPAAPRLLGYHQRLDGQRLDHLAWRYLKDATAFWKLCDSNDTMVPDTLATHDLIGIPPKD
jgi:hypothetical protein